MPEIISSMTDWIPFLQNYPTIVKVFAILTGFCLLLTAATALILGPMKSNAPTQQSNAQPSKVTEKPKGDPRAKLFKKSKSKTTPLEAMVQNNETGKNEQNVNKGTNSGIIGGSNNTINNITNIGIQPRRVEPAMIAEFRRNFPDTALHIRFIGYNGVDAEMTVLKDNIIASLRAAGYNNINESWNLMYADEPARIQFGPTAVGATFYIPHNR
ncbi:hypothetical protein [Dyadobacter fermentans]|uniref:hypothetical protein n=1 Tax=Dyadobacter fermentans TaxID=94254 RepID=UPI001CBFCFAC|nr:hypothetical protein [Dyadobacter fermentans]MBZ1362155.1 hypothetical protein [Dyadobacter fermentans]